MNCEFGISIDNLTDNEKDILCSLNKTKTEYKIEKTIHELFEEQVNRTPDNTAVVFKSEKLTYRQLNEKANQIARVLRTKGVKPNTVVGIMVERSIYMITAMMAVLKAGGAYLPIDPSYPKDRIEYIIEDSGTKILITQSSLDISKTFETDRIEIDNFESYKADSSNLVNINNPKDLIYLIYTSGSTGRPKGVMLEHRGVNNFIKGVTDKIDFNSKKVIISLTTMSFDIFVLETLLPLTIGLKILIADPRAMYNAFEDSGLKEVELMQTTPSTMKLILNDKRNIPYLKGFTDIMLGGEALPASLLMQMKDIINAKIFNMYGPTETTVWSAIKEIDETNNINIGRPIANTRIYIVDEDNRVQPVGIIGEICIGGDSVARGYMNMPELTAQKFVVDPFEKDSRVYRTGDLGRWLENGEIEYLGRIDHQVKIRGFRIELGEIENSLSNINGIEQCVVSSQKNEDNEDYLVGYYVSDKELSVSEIIKSLAGKLPEYMIPGFYMRLNKIPLTPNGKIDRNVLPEPNKSRPKLDTEYVESGTKIEKQLVEIWKRVLNRNTIGINDNFFELGGNSILLSLMHKELDGIYPNKTDITDVFAYPCVSMLAKYISDSCMEELNNEQESKQPEYLSYNRTSMSKNKDIAIIGLACRFASANKKEEYWDILKDGKMCIRDLPEERKRNNQDFLVKSEISREKWKYYKGGFLEEVDKFDYDFFSISPKEASLMSPNQRIFLEMAWNAIEDAGYSEKKLAGTKTGVFIGHSTDFGISYREYIEKLCPSKVGFSISGNLNSIISSRIAYIMDLKGPSLVVDTACSSTLVAIHMACRSIEEGECDMALAGGVKTDLLPLLSIKSREDELGITSLDGITKTFDDQADGTGLGEGVAVIMLKPLDKAIKNRDSIYAVIKGSAVNQDGKSVGLTAPNMEAQKELLQKAWKDAGVNPETISYIEAHGTGTVLGDPIEVKAMQKAFSKYTNKEQFCAIGSVKTNIGHLDNVAGIAGLIKVVLSLKYKQMPPTINFRTPNRKINFKNSPVYVNRKLQEWKSLYSPRRCGVSAFGLSGTNCHIVLEEAPLENTIEKAVLSNYKRIFTLSAKSREVLANYIEIYKQFLSEEINIDDLCYTLGTGRGHYNCRLAIIFESIEELKIKLEHFSKNITNPENCSGAFYGEHRLISDKKKAMSETDINEFQKIEMTFKAQALIKSYKENAYNNLNNLFEELCIYYINGSDINWEEFYWGHEFKTINIPVYPFARTTCWIKADNSVDNNFKFTHIDKHPFFDICLPEEFDRITYISYFNIKKDWILNEHKVSGVYVVPGTTYLEMVFEAVKEKFSGCNLELTDIVFISPLVAEDSDNIEVHTIITTDNPLKFTIVSKSKTEKKWVRHVKGNIVVLNEISKEKVDIAYLMRQCSDSEFKEYAYEPGKSIETGSRWNCVKETFSGKDKYMAHICLDEEFKNEEKIFNIHPALLDEAVNIAIRSIGNGLYLPFSYKSIKAYKKMPGSFYSYAVRKDKNAENDEVASFDITLFDGSGEVFADIKDYIIKRVNNDNLLFSGRLPCLNKFYYSIGWIQKQLLKDKKVDGSILIVKGEDQLSSNLCRLLIEKGKEVIEVSIGEMFGKADENHYIISQDRSRDYKRLFEMITDRDISTVILLNLLNPDKNNNIFSIHDLKVQIENGLYNLFYLTKALLGSQEINKNSIDMFVIADNTNEITCSEDRINPHNAAILGFGKVINMEYPKLNLRCIDVDDSITADNIIAELSSESSESTVAYRNGLRYVEELRENDIDVISDNEIKFVNDGLYIITGGTGWLGLEIAKFITDKKIVKLALINRSVFPERNMWDEITEEAKDKNLCNKINAIRQIESNGSEVLLYSADVSDMNALKSVIDELRNRYGRIRGIIHTAGVAGDGFILRKDKKIFNEVIAPKIYGTWVIDKLTENDNLDFYILFSSVSSIIPEPGQGDYTAANCYMDSYATFRKRKGKRTLSINWTAWNDVGMAVEYNAIKEDDLFKPISTDTAIGAFKEVINKDVSNIIIGEVNYSNAQHFRLLRIDNSILGKIDTNNSSLHKKHPSKEITDVPNMTLKGRQDGIYTEAEKKIAAVWSKVLGFNELDIYDKFLDLGGNSILAIEMEAEMEKECIPIDLTDIYNFSSIKEQADYLSGYIKMDNQSTGTSLVKEENKERFVGKNELNRKVIEGIMPFNDVFYKYCFYNSLFPVIRSLNRSIYLFLANNVLCYTVKKDSGVDNSDIGFVSNKKLKTLLESLGILVITKLHKSRKTKDIQISDSDILLLRNFSKDIGISVNHEECEGIVSDIKTAVSNGRTVILWVDCFYESIRKDTYLQVHWPHTLLIYGFNESKEEFDIIEHNFRGNLTYKQRIISYKDITHSYEGFLANFAPYTDMPTYYEFYSDNSSDSTESFKYDYKSIYLDNVRNSTQHIYSGLAELGSFLSSFKESIQNEEVLWKKIDFFVECLNSIINAKKVERYSIKEIFGNDEVCIRLDNVLSMWEAARALIVKIQYAGIIDKEKIDKLSGIVSDLYKVEKEYYDKSIKTVF